MTLRMIVVGGGAAGTAAAWFARQAGANVLLIRHLPGTTELYSGALDLEAWQELPATEVDEDLTAFARALGVWSLERTRCRVSTGAGVARPARGMDHALLDLEPLAGHKVGVVDTDREHYDGRQLARALDESDWAKGTGTHFEPVPVNVLRREQERRYGIGDFAELHDSPERVEWLAEQLNHASQGHDAWLLGPWLGSAPDAVAHLRLALLRPVGETTSLPGGPAGLRFRRARDRLLTSLGVSVTIGRVQSFSRDQGGWSAELEDSTGDEHASATYLVQGHAVVLAVGGLVSGAIELAPRGSTGDSFRLTLDAPVELSAGGSEPDGGSSLYGPVLDHPASRVLERVGIVTQAGAVDGQPQFYAAGACMAGRPRTVLEAARSGIMAARMAVRRSVRPLLLRR